MVFKPHACLRRDASSRKRNLDRPLARRSLLASVAKSARRFPIHRRYCCSNDTHISVPLHRERLFAHACLRICDPSPTILHPTSGGIHDCRAVRKFSVCSYVRNHARGSGAADRKPRLHLRAAAGMRRRCVPPLQLGDSRHRSHHGLHDQEQIPVVAWLPGTLSIG